jgi:uncharacterized membrane protein
MSVLRRDRLSRAYGLRLLFEPRIQRIGLLVLLVAALLPIRVFQLFGLSGNVAWGYDLTFYWRAAQHVLDGQSVYAPFQLAGPYPPQGVAYEYLYPPFLAVALAPIVAVFPDQHAANWLWMAAGFVILALSVAFVMRREQIARGFDHVLLLGVMLAYAPVVSELIIGNVHLLILGLLSGAWLAIRRGTSRSEMAAGALVGIATLIKVFPGLLLLWFLLTGRTRAFVAGLATMIVLMLVTLPVVGVQPWLDYPAVLLNLGAPTELTDVLAPTAFLSEVLPALAAKLIVVGIGLALVVWSARRRSDAISFAIAVATSVLVSPALYPHYLAILVLPMLLAVRYAPPLWWVALVWLSATGGGPEVFGDLTWIANRLVPMLGGLLLVAGLAWNGREVSSVPDAVPVGAEP